MAESLIRFRSADASRYVVEREIGHGGTALVYLAHDTRHDRQVAIKVLRPDLADALGAERFQREIRVAAKLQHPNILPVFDSGGTEDSFFYVMPYVEGESLHQKLKRDRQLSVEEALRIICAVADALAYAHDQHVVHRDIKPENILISNGQPIVADFGIARAMSVVGGERLTGTGLSVGTPAYMSPEQAAGELDVDGRSDQYSLACVLYEMLVGQPPFVGATPQEVIAQRFTGTPPAVRSRRQRVPKHVDSTITRALCRTPADRYQSIREFAAALGPVGAPMHEPEETPRGRLALVAGLALTALLAVGAILMFGNRDASGAADPNQYAILPLRMESAGLPLDGGDASRLLYDAFSRWQGVQLVDPLRLSDLVQQGGGEVRTIEDARALAIRAGAGSFIFGAVTRDPGGGGIVIDITHYESDGRSARARFRTAQSVTLDLDGLHGAFERLADSLLVHAVGDIPHGLAGAGAAGTRVLPASRSYLGGHAALSTWSLDEAEDHFRSAVGADPAYPEAHFWLAQVIAWARTTLPSDFGSVTARAMSLADRLPERDRMAVAALSAIADGRFPDACGLYRGMISRDTFDFAAWYGLGECHRRDTVVVRDPSQPSGFRYRGSMQQAITGYRRALQLIPSVHTAFAGLAYERLPRMLYTSPTQLRFGWLTEAGTTRLFAATADLVADTIAFNPYPLEDVTAGKPATFAQRGTEAAQRNAALLADIARTWVDRFPRSADAHAQLALALEASGDLAGREGALRYIRSARALTTDSLAALTFAVHEVRMVLKTGDFVRAATEADSLLRAVRDPSAMGARLLMPVAAMLGRVDHARGLAARAASIDTAITRAGRTPIPPALGEAHRVLLLYAAVGMPADSVRAAKRRFDRALDSWVTPAQRRQIRDALLGQALGLGFPTLQPGPQEDELVANDWLLRTQQLMGRGDRAGALAVLDGILQSRQYMRPGDVTIDAALQEARLMLMMGDSTRATQVLDLALSGLPVAGSAMLSQVPQAGVLPRAMLLRAELAALGGEHQVAERWATGAAALWQYADSPLVPDAQRARGLATRPR